MITLILWSVLFELPVCLGWTVVLLLFAHVNFIVRRNLHGSFITLKCRLFIRQVNGFNRASRLYHSIVHLIMVPIWIEITTNCTNSRRFKTAFWLEITYLKPMDSRKSWPFALHLDKLVRFQFVKKSAEAKSKNKSQRFFKEDFNFKMSSLYL